MSDQYPTGPTTQSGITSNWAPLPADVGDIPSAALLAASDLVYKFATIFGFDKQVDWGAVITDLARSGRYTSPQDAYNQILFDGRFNSTRWVTEMPWLLLGMNRDDYTTAAEKMQNAYSNLTGEQLSGVDLQRALKEGWSASDLQNFATYGDPRGAAYSRVRSDLSSMPWLASGTSFQQASQSYATETGSTVPVDTATLASWWKFKSGARQIGGAGAGASMSEAAPGSQAAQFSRQPQDTEVR